jgi:hypothetical protein
MDYRGEEFSEKTDELGLPETTFRKQRIRRRKDGGFLFLDGLLFFLLLFISSCHLIVFLC